MPISRKLALEQGAQRAIEKIMQTTEDDTVEGTLEDRGRVPGQRHRTADGTCKTSPITASNVTVTWRLECTDGGGAITARRAPIPPRSTRSTCASGTEREARYIQVSVTDRYAPLFPIHFSGLNADGTYHLSATAGMRTRMKLVRQLHRDERGAAAIEMAFALPVLVVMIWTFVQLAQVYRAVAGIQQALGEGARYATLCLNPIVDRLHCADRRDQVKTKINNSVYGIGPGTFTVADPGERHSGTEQILRPQGQLLAADQPAPLPGPDGDGQPLEAGLDRRRLTAAPVRASACRRRRRSPASLRLRRAARRTAPLSSFIRSSTSSRAPWRSRRWVWRSASAGLASSAATTRSSVGVELPGRRAMADEPDGQGFLDPERLAQQQIARGAPAAGEPRQQQRARGFGHQREVDERQREARAFLGDDQVAMKQHGRADADAIAVDRGDDRRFAGGERAQQAPHRDVAVVAGQRVEEIGKVVAGGEILAFAAEGDRPGSTCRRRRPRSRRRGRRTWRR